MNFTVIPMNSSHITVLAELEKCCFSTPWSENSFREELVNPLSHFFVAVGHDRLIGYIGAQELVGESYISNIAVLPEYRRTGVAQALLERAMQGAKERGCAFVTLEVRVSNTAAVALYEKNGFAVAGRRKLFYRHPDEDAFIMTRYFNNSAQPEGDNRQKMKSAKTWSFAPYRQLDDELEYAITVCRLAPNIDFIELEWLYDSTVLSDSAEFTLHYKSSDERTYTTIVATGRKAKITGLKPDTEYELTISSGNQKSCVRLARTGFVPGTVVNYLHPQDEAYSFSGRYLCSPSLVKLPGGPLLACMDLFASRAPQNLSLLFRSDDGGDSWYYLTDLFPCFWGKLFVHKNELYMLAMSTEYGDLLIGKSTDDGKNFCKPEVLFRGSCSHLAKGLHKAPMPVTNHAGRLWTAIDYGAWSLGGHSSSLLSVDENADLMKAENWTLTKPLAYNPHWAGAVKGTSRGLLEGSAVVSPTGDIINFLGYKTAECLPDRDRAIMLKGDINCPGKKLEFYKTVDFYGNRSKFSVLYDDVTKQYFSIVNRLQGDYTRGMRNIASLSVSSDLVHWRILCDLLDYSALDTEKVAFQYIDFLFDGDDLLYLSRTAFNDAANFHNSNYCTFHRVKEFRGLL